MIGMTFERQVKGQPIKADTLNKMMEALEYLTNISATPPIEIITTAAGPLIRHAGSRPIHHGKTSSAITARAGTAMGFGNVTPYQNDNGTLVASSGLPDVKVWNDLGGVIATGVYVKYTIINEQYTLVTADCSGVA